MNALSTPNRTQPTEPASGRGIDAASALPCQETLKRPEGRAPITAFESIEEFEATGLRLPQVECPVKNLFSSGIYWREVSIPAGVFALGHQHKTEHLNVLLSGRVLVLKDGSPTELVAPQVFASPAGTRKMVLALEPTRWANVHANPTDERDLEKLELIFIEKSAAFIEYQAELKQLEQAAAQAAKERSK